LQQIQAIAGTYFEHGSYRLEWMEGGCEDLNLCRRWILELAASFRADIIHCNSYSLADAPFCAPVLVVAHSCVYSWWRAVHGANPPAEWSGYRNAVAAGLRSATAVVAPTRSMLDSVATNYDVDLPNSCVIHNGIELPAFRSAPKRPFILGAGRIWDESKNFCVLGEAAAGLQWPIRIAGAAERPEGGRALRPRNVELLGPLPQPALHQAMCDAAVFAHPAIYEPFGLAILEAAQRECALVLSDIPSLRELWDDAAVFCSPRDRDAWVTALETISNRDDLRHDLAFQARSRGARFTTEQMVDGYQRLYRKMAIDHRRETRWERAS
jgi:glycosyltransferase involved in cell wall biosynthesis